MPVEQYDFVVFLDADWEATTQKNRQHFLIAELARELEGHSKVLAVERPICPWTNPFRKREEFIQWLEGRRGLRQVGPNFYVCTPFVFVHNLIAANVPGMTRLNCYLLRGLLRRALRKLDFRADNLVAWIHHPYQLEDVGLMGEKLLVYDCYDDYFSQARGWRLGDLRRREAAISGRADLVLAASEPLLEAIQGRAQQVHLVPNAVDVDLFAQATNPETEVPAEIAALPHPVIGFVGRVAAWLDFELLAWLAAAHSEWSFSFVGMHDGERKLSGRPGYRLFRQALNVHLFGPRPHASLPGYLKAFDVCIIPYLPEGQVPSSSPLKLYEYLGAGKPIVSVDIPQVARLQPPVRIAGDAAEFEQAILVSLSEDSDGPRQRMLAAARENSWQRRAEQVLQIIDRALTD